MNNKYPSQFWDERYSHNPTVYGYNPNYFFKELIDKMEPGKLLLPCEGEGRNALYAAKLGWQVDAFDFSEVAMQKTLQAAQQQQLVIHYEQKSVEDYKASAPYNLIACIYVHQPEAVRKPFHRQLILSLAKNGTLIIEAFNKKQINYTSGGPGNAAFMYSVEELQNDFKELHIHLLEEKSITLEEGSFHKGQAEIIRMVASLQ
jgi:Tellurite resistance protein TehB.